MQLVVLSLDAKLPFAVITSYEDLPLLRDHDRAIFAATHILNDHVHRFQAFKNGRCRFESWLDMTEACGAKATAAPSVQVSAIGD